MSMLQGCSKAWENTSRSTTTHYHSPILRLKNCTSDWVSLNLVGLPVNWSCTCLSRRVWTQRYLTSAAISRKVLQRSWLLTTKQNPWWEWGLKEAPPIHRLSVNKWSIAQTFRQVTLPKQLKLSFWTNKLKRLWTTLSVALRQERSKMGPLKTISFRSTMPASRKMAKRFQLMTSRASIFKLQSLLAS